MTGLAGARVLVTRPRERAQGLVDRIAAAGGIPVAFPTIAIEANPAAELPPPGAYGGVIFVSPAAVVHGVRRLGHVQAALVAAVGPATAAALAERGATVDVEPVGSSDSEGLLRHPALGLDRVRGRHFVIVRGGSGRAELGDTLVARGATVHYADVYRRVRPAAADAGPAAASDVVTATSNEGLENLVAMLDRAHRATVLERPLVVASARTGERARMLGFRGPIEAAGGADDEAMMAAIRRAADRAATHTAQGR